MPGAGVGFVLRVCQPRRFFTLSSEYPSLIDPLGDDPIVVTGTANFSGPSQDSNDDNMLVIRGNKRVADIYFSEFMRIFDHLYSRYVIEKLHAAGKLDPKSGYLKENTGDWITSHFKTGSPT